MHAVEVALGHVEWLIVLYCFHGALLSLVKLKLIVVPPAFRYALLYLIKVATVLHRTTGERTCWELLDA